jgi:glycosyltransferase involved in cell wall biosynthesis
VKNILLIIPNLTFGGAQQSFVTLADVLSKEYNVIIVHFDKHDTIAYNLKGEIVSLNVKGSTSFFGKIVSFLSRIKKLREIKSKHKIFASISFLEGADYINILSGGSDFKILSVRGSKLNDPNIKGLLGWVRKNIFIPYIYKFASKIVVVNEGIKKEFTDVFKIKASKISVINNFYDLHKLKSLGNKHLPSLYDKLLSQPYIISSGRLSHEKGLIQLIEIFSLIKIKLPNYKLVIVGDGKLYAELLQKLISLKLSYSKIGEEFTDDKDVCFVGYEDNPHRFVSKAKLFIMTSVSEGFPNALAESLICGTPVMSTDCPWGPREILAPNTTINHIKQIEFGEFGVLMPVLDNENKEIISVCAEGIIQLLTNESLLNSYKVKGLNRMESFSIDLMFDTWKSIIEGLA